MMKTPFEMVRKAEVSINLGTIVHDYQFKILLDSSL